MQWHAVAAAGNVYRHAYDFLDPAVVWQTAAVELQPLEAAAKAELDLLDGNRNRG